MATHSSILTWKIPWTEESGGLQSMGSQRVRHNLATNPTPPLERMYQAVQSRQDKPALCILNEKQFNKGDYKDTSILKRLGSRRQHGHSRLSRNPKVQKLQVSCCQLPLRAGAPKWMSLRETTGSQQASYLTYAIPHMTPTPLSEA